MNKVLKSIILFVIILSCINTSVIAEDGLNTNNEEYLVSETFGDYFIGLKTIAFVTDENANNIIVLTMDYSHNKWTKKTYYWNINTEVTQDGVKCVHSEKWSSDNRRDEIKAGVVIQVKEAFILRSGTPIQIKFSPAFNFATGEVTYTYTGVIPVPEVTSVPMPISTAIQTPISSTIPTLVATPNLTPTATQMPTETPFVSSARENEPLDSQQIQSSFPKLEELIYNFNVASLMMDSDHYIQADNWSIKSGNYASTVTINLSNTLALLITIPNNTDCINEIILLYISDGTNNSAIGFISALGELLYAVGAIDNLDETGELLDNLCMLDNLNDGDSNSIVIGDLKYSYSVSSLVGILFSVSSIE